jgi:hypothetical protein
MDRRRGPDRAPMAYQIGEPIEDLDFNELLRLAQSLATLSAMAKALAAAKDMRLNGFISGAMQSERTAEDHYAALPPNWRW